MKSLPSFAQSASVMPALSSTEGLTSNEFRAFLYGEPELLDGPMGLFEAHEGLRVGIADKGRPSELEILKNTELFLHISVSFFPVLGLLCILRYTIQGVGYTNLAMLSGVSEMIARILVSLLAVPAFGYLAVCFGDPTAWIFADAFLIPAFIYVYRRILRMKKN